MPKKIKKEVVDLLSPAELAVDNIIRLVHLGDEVRLKILAAKLMLSKSRLNSLRTTKILTGVGTGVNLIASGVNIISDTPNGSIILVCGAAMGWMAAMFKYASSDRKKEKARRNDLALEYLRVQERINSR